jgi:hypothetical protein
VALGSDMDRASFGISPVGGPVLAAHVHPDWSPVNRHLAP